MWVVNFLLCPLYSGIHPGTNPASCSVDIPRVISLGVKLTTHLHLVPRSRMCGAIPSLPQYAFMAWCSVTKIKHRDKFAFAFMHP